MSPKVRESFNRVAQFVAERKHLEKKIRIRLNNELAQEQRRKEYLDYL
jgi:hypothetical protein